MKLLHETDVKDIIDLALTFTLITEKEFISSSRRTEIVMARVVISYCLIYLGLPLKLIGRVVLRDHATVIHYKKLIFDDSLTRGFITRFRDFASSRGIFVPSLEDWENYIENIDN